MQKQRFEKLFNEYLEALYMDLKIEVKLHLPLGLWVKNSALHHEEKREVYAKAYSIAFGKDKKMNEYHERVTYWLTYHRHKYLA